MSDGVAFKCLEEASIPRQDEERIQHLAMLDLSSLGLHFVPHGDYFTVRIVENEVPRIQRTYNKRL